MSISKPGSAVEVLGAHGQLASGVQIEASERFVGINNFRVGGLHKGVVTDRHKRDACFGDKSLPDP